MDFLAEFKYDLEYMPGKTNQVADALSRKGCLAPIISILEGTTLGRIKEGLDHDPQAQRFMELVREGKTTRFWVEDGVLFTKGN